MINKTISREKITFCKRVFWDWNPTLFTTPENKNKLPLRSSRKCESHTTNSQTTTKIYWEKAYKHQAAGSQTRSASFRWERE